MIALIGGTPVETFGGPDDAGFPRGLNALSVFGRVLDAFGLDRAHVVGLSYGGGVAAISRRPAIRPRDPDQRG